MGEPARGYSWPPFEKGNRAAWQHGVRSAGRAEAVAAEVEELAADVAVRYPWTAAYLDERRAYARALVDERDVQTYLDQVGLMDSQGRERSAVRTLERCSGRAARCRSRLGLNPAAHARLLLMVAGVVRSAPASAGLDGALEELMAQGRAALAAGSEGSQPPVVGLWQDEAAGGACGTVDGPLPEEEVS